MNKSASEKRSAIFVWGSSRPGGAERRFLRLFAYLRESGHDILLYTSETGLAWCESVGIHLDRCAVRVFPAPASNSRGLLYVALVRRTLQLLVQLRRDRISHLHFGENPGPLTFLYGLAAWLACPFSVSLVDSIKDYQRNARQRFYVTGTARACKYIDCLSSQIRVDLVSFLGARYDAKCLTSPCSFTDYGRARINESTRQTRDIDIAMIARFTPGKGHTLLRDALSELGRSGVHGLTVYVCGSGPLDSQIREQFASLTKQEVHIYFERDPFRILLRTKIYASLQEIENYPSQSLLEAMACGCAIVATDVGLTRCLLDEACAALVPNSAVEVAAAIRSLLDRELDRCSMGMRAREVAVTTQTVDRFADYFLADILGRREEASEL